jgi:hypothetical protein
MSTSLAILTESGSYIILEAPAGSYPDDLITEGTFVNPVVQAVAEGFYNEVYYYIGDIFALLNFSDFDSNLTNDYAGTSDTPVYGWMMAAPTGAQINTNVLGQWRLVRNHIRRTCL